MTCHLGGIRGVPDRTPEGLRRSRNPPRRRWWLLVVVITTSVLVTVAVGACSGQPAKTTFAPATAASARVEQNLPAYEPSTGFEPDAARILTVTSIRISLEEYRAANGAYPASLDALFPSFAPLGQNGQAMTAPPPVSDGYAYVQTGTTSYTLSVQLSNGQTYSVTAPEGP